MSILINLSKYCISSNLHTAGGGILQVRTKRQQTKDSWSGNGQYPSFIIPVLEALQSNPLGETNIYFPISLSHKIFISLKTLSIHFQFQFLLHDVGIIEHGSPDRCRGGLEAGKKHFVSDIETLSFTTQKNLGRHHTRR